MPRLLPLLLLIALAAAPAAAAAEPPQDVSYRVTYTGHGTYHQDWQRVEDEDTSQTNTTDLFFEWAAVYEHVRFRDGALVAPERDLIPHGEATGTHREVHRSLTNSFSVDCQDLDDDIGEAVLGHGLDISEEEEMIVLRPAETFTANFACPNPEFPGEYWHPAFSLHSPGMGLDPWIMGAGPLDAVITLPREAIGAGKIVEPVSIRADQWDPERCPGQAVDEYTTGCTFQWVGQVELLREDYVKERPEVSVRLNPAQRRIVLTVRCRSACRGLINVAFREESGRRRHLAQLAYRTAGGRPQTLSRRLSQRAWPRGATVWDIKTSIVPR